MNVQVHHALAHAVIDRHKRSLGFHGCLNGPSEQLCISEEWADKIRRQIGHRFIMRARNQQAVAGKQWTLVQKRNRYFILENDARRFQLGSNGAKRTGHAYQFLLTNL